MGLLTNANAVSKQVADADLGATIRHPGKPWSRVTATTAELGKTTEDLKSILGKIEGIGKVPG